MPLRMIFFILALMVLVCFVGLNWDNSSNIDLWFNQGIHFENVSIVLSFLVVYLLGILSSIPFWVDLSLRKKHKAKKQEKKIQALQTKTTKVEEENPTEVIETDS
ncbi:MAG: hypothetical protein PF447_09200 [Spirochaetaceae bacterium]|nr:hypothetical protein [Spirochaetaceae bacterium]